VHYTTLRSSRLHQRIRGQQFLTFLSKQLGSHFSSVGCQAATQLQASPPALTPYAQPDTLLLLRCRSTWALATSLASSRRARAAMARLSASSARRCGASSPACLTPPSLCAPLSTKGQCLAPLRCGECDKPRSLSASEQQQRPCFGGLPELGFT
jgi:hypothetical protein